MQAFLNQPGWGGAPELVLIETSWECDVAGLVPRFARPELAHPCHTFTECPADASDQRTFC